MRVGMKILSERRRCAVTTALVLSNNFIRKTLNEEIPLSPMKLQKMIYFAYRDYLQQTGNQIFSEPFSAWKYGPVVESVYYQFNAFGAKSITKFYRDSIGDVRSISESGTIGDIINAIWREYKLFDGIRLSQITHREGTAWHKAWISSVPYLEDEDIRNERT